MVGKERTRATERKERARTSPKVPVGKETKEAASATEGNRVVVLSLRTEKVRATTVIDLLPETGKQRFVVCIF